MTPEIASHLSMLVFAALVILAAMKDLASFTIPNWISATLALAFAPAAWLSGLPIAVIGGSVGLAIGVLVAAAGMFALRWLGGGDAKLLAAASLWVGIKGLIVFAVFTGLGGGALALALLALRSAWLRPITAAGPTWTRRLATPGEAAPYGVAIAFGALVAVSLPHPLV
jgi:prepilin peptidase CpaA